MLQPSDLRAGLELLQRGDATFVISVTTFAIQRALRRDVAGFVEMMQPEHVLTRSQHMGESWHDAGQFCLARAVSWVAGTPVFSPGAAGLDLPRSRVEDIDTLEDWRRAEALFALLQRNG